MESKEKLIPIRVKTLKSNFELTFNIYLKMKIKDLLYFKQGIGFTEDHLLSLTERKIKKLHIQEADEQIYQSYLENYLVELNKSGDGKKVDVVKAVCKDNVDFLLDDPSSNKAYQKAQYTSKILSNTLKSNESILSELLKTEEGINNKKDKIKKHLLDSSSIVLKFCDQLNIGDEQAQLLGTAALYQDISFDTYSENDQNLFFKDIENMDSTQKVIYYTHPKKAADIAKEIGVADSKFLKLVEDHEEKLDGQGFPNMSTKLTSDQQILNMCCLFSHRINCLGYNVSEVVKNFNTKELGKFDLDILNKFRDFINTQKFN